jgi:cytochrome bd-type quinol oxidase subunit 2
MTNTGEVEKPTKFERFERAKNWISKAKKTINPMLDSVQWSVFTLFFGLLQIWLILASNLVLKNQEISFEQIILDGALLFFSTAIVSSLTIDRHIKHKTFNSDEIIVFYLFPFSLVLLCVWLFSLCYGKSVEEVDFKFILNVELVVLLMAISYGFIVKFFTYREEDNDI